MLLVRSHEHQCLLERHILEGRHREAHHVHRLGHLGLLAHGVHPGRLDELFLELLQRASSVLCGFHPFSLVTPADPTRAQTPRNPRSQARGCAPGAPASGPSRPTLARISRFCGQRRSRPDKESETPPNSPLSLRSCRSRSFSALFASASACRVCSFWVACSSASAFLCSAWPSAFLSSSPATAP